AVGSNPGPPRPAPTCPDRATLAAPVAPSSSSAAPSDSGSVRQTLAAAPAAPPGPADKLRETTLQSSRALDTVRSLVDNVGARLAGSPGDRAAVAWALRTLQAAGLSHVRAEKVTVPHWERGTETGALVSPYRQRLSLTALGGSVATPK